MTETSTPAGQDSGRESSWAKPVDRLKAAGVAPEAMSLNVEGRRLTGPVKGFGQMWQKTYSVRLSGAKATPAEVIAAWKENYPKFWPKGNRFYAPLAGIKPGEIAVINVSGPGNAAVLSTGVMVIYSDDESFSFMTPEGHPMAGMITFSAHEEESATVAQVQVLIRANDPLYELGFRLGPAHRMEDDMWRHTLEMLAAHFNVQGQVNQRTTLVDPRVQWAEARNIWHNAGIRTGLHLMMTPVRWLRGLGRRKPSTPVA